LVILDKINLTNYKTKEAKKILDNITDNKSRVLIILGNEEENKDQIIKSFDNLCKVETTSSSLLNTYQLLANEKLVVTYSALAEIERRLI
jgi:ribosomal protein L4